MSLFPSKWSIFAKSWRFFNEKKIWIECALYSLCSLVTHQPHRMATSTFSTTSKFVKWTQNGAQTECVSFRACTWETNTPWFFINSMNSSLLFSPNNEYSQCKHHYGGHITDFNFYLFIEHKLKIKAWAIAIDPIPLWLPVLHLLHDKWCWLMHLFGNFLLFRSRFFQFGRFLKQKI